MTPRRRETFQPELQDSIAQVLAGWGTARPDLPVEPIAVTARLARLQSRLGPRLEEVFARFGLRGTDFAALATLVRLEGESVSQRRLGTELGLTPGTISLRIDRLVGRGLVDRQPDPDDGRGAVISLTRRGRELFEACAPEHLTNARELLSGLAEDERDELGRLLGKLLYTLEDTTADDPGSPELGLVLEGAPVALERRRAVGLPPLEGLLVRHVDPGGPAAASGIRPGDLLTSADRRPLRSQHDLQLAMLRSRAKRRPMALEITRGAEPMRVALTTPAPRPARH
jgi:DNA-binding MarR family transcriptional regulator